MGSKALTVKQAVVLAAIFEFLGALLMGSNVSKTIRKSIADPDCFDDNPGARPARDSAAGGQIRPPNRPRRESGTPRAQASSSTA